MRWLFQVALEGPQAKPVYQALWAWIALVGGGGRLWASKCSGTIAARKRKDSDHVSWESSVWGRAPAPDHGETLQSAQVANGCTGVILKTVVHTLSQKQLQKSKGWTSMSWFSTLQGGMQTGDWTGSELLQRWHCVLLCGNISVTSNPYNIQMGLNIRVPRNRWRRRAGWMIRRTTNWVEQTNKMMSVFERLNGAWSRDRETQEVAQWLPGITF